MTVEIINGSRTSFGPRTTEVKTPKSVYSAGVEKQLVLHLKAGEMPSHTANDATGAFIPAGSFIKEVIVMPSTTTFATGVSVDIDLVELDGTTIDTIEAAVTTATLNAGTVLAHSALDYGVVGADDAYVEISQNTAYTAGEGVMIIVYIPPVV